MHLFCGTFAFCLFASSSLFFFLSFPSSFLNFLSVVPGLNQVGLMQARQRKPRRFLVLAHRLLFPESGMLSGALLAPLACAIIPSDFPTCCEYEQLPPGQWNLSFSFPTGKEVKCQLFSASSPGPDPLLDRRGQILVFYRCPLFPAVHGAHSLSCFLCGLGSDESHLYPWESCLTDSLTLPCSLSLPSAPILHLPTLLCASSHSSSCFLRWGP